MVSSPPSCFRCLHISGTVLNELGFGCRGESTPWNIFLGGFIGRMRKGPAAWIGIYPFFKEKWGNSAALQMSALEFSVVWGRICFSCWVLCVKSSSERFFFFFLGLSVGTVAWCYWALLGCEAAEWGMHNRRVSSLWSCLGKTTPRLFVFLSTMSSIIALEFWKME